MSGGLPRTSLTDDEVRVIDRLRPAVSALFRRFDADLQREQRLSFGDYIVLFFVSQAPDQTLGLSELAARCQQSLSSISRTIGRLKADGLVRREQSARDARAYNAILTDAGLARLQRDTPVHHDCVRHYLLDQMLGVVLRAMEAAGCAAPPPLRPALPAGSVARCRSTRPGRCARTHRRRRGFCVHTQRVTADHITFRLFVCERYHRSGSRVQLLVAASKYKFDGASKFLSLGRIPHHDRSPEDRSAWQPSLRRRNPQLHGVPRAGRQSSARAGRPRLRSTARQASTLEL